jgi:hypothetical protein
MSTIDVAVCSWKMKGTACSLCLKKNKLKNGASCRAPWTAQFWPARRRNKSDGQTESTAPTEAGTCQNVRVQEKILSYYNNFNAVFVAAADITFFTHRGSYLISMMSKNLHGTCEQYPSPVSKLSLYIWRCTNERYVGLIFWIDDCSDFCVYFESEGMDNCWLLVQREFVTEGASNWPRFVWISLNSSRIFCLLKGPKS